LRDGQSDDVEVSNRDGIVIPTISVTAKHNCLVWSSNQNIIALAATETKPCLPQMIGSKEIIVTSGFRLIR
jgi:hypothetical protein